MQTLPLTADPDVEQAIEDFAGTVLELERATERLGECPSSAKYDAALAQCTELRGNLATRAERINLPTDTLIALIKARLADKARPSMTPLYGARRSLMDEVAAAEQTKQDTDRVLALAERNAKVAAARLHGAEVALSMFSARQSARARQLEDA